MLFEIEPMNTRESELSNFPVATSSTADPNHPSPLMRRKMNLEKLNLKTYSSHELSRELSCDNPPSASVAEAQATNQKNDEPEETKTNSFYPSLKLPEPIVTEKDPTKFLKPEYGRLPQEWLLRNQEDGSQSPFPVKRSIMAPLEFSEEESLRADRGESNQTYGGFDSPNNGFNGQINQSKKVSRFSSDYDILEIIGQGSFGKVYRCVNKLDKKEYAVKEATRKFIGKYKAYGLNEMKALALLTSKEDNADVVRYYHSWVENEKLFLVMEYCPSSLTKQRAVKEQFGEAELKKIARDVCLSLDYLHRNNLAHLDVKTENILVSKQNRYKLGDMGQTKELHSSADIDEGDSRYLAPEFFNSNISKEKRDYKKVDIFSLGMTLYELATDQNLPKNGSEWNELRNEKFTRLQEVRHLSQNFKNLIELMLKKDPTQRPSANELLNKYLQSEEEINIKWENIVEKLLEDEKKDLEVRQESNKKRRRSIS